MRILLCLAFLGLLACGGSTTPQPEKANEPDKRSERSALFDKAESDVRIGASLSASRFSELYFSGQPSNDDLRALYAQGFRTVINLRHPSEYDEASEAALSSELGFHYENIPFAKSDELTEAYVDQVTQAVVAHREDGKLLVHCGSGNRVGIWLGGHFQKDHGLSKAEAEEMAKALGLTSPKALEKLQRYLEHP